MQHTEQVIQHLKRIKNSLKLRYPIKSIALFGSVLREDFSSSSDIDILIDFDGAVGSRFIDLALELEQELNRKVDLVSLKGVKKKYLDAISPDLRYV